MSREVFYGTSTDGELKLGCLFGWRGHLAEVSVGEDHGGHQGPDVKSQTHPAGGDLRPHRRPLAADSVVSVRAERKHRLKIYLMIDSRPEY